VTAPNPPRPSRAELTERIARRIAREFRDGQVVNLGAGLPMACVDYIPADLDIVFHSEQGLLGYGARVSRRDEINPYLLNAGRQAVLPRPGMAIVDHAGSFSIVRSGRIDITVLGGLQVSVTGDLANCWLPGKVAGGMGGAQDLADRAAMVVVAMGHLAQGEPRIVEKLSLPATAIGCVDLVVTDLAVLRITPGGAVLEEYAPGWDPEQIVSLGRAPIAISPRVREIGPGPA
jgi:3-oxoacid CoA-transferase B subunit